ncbi:hypothetical protein [uncultured Methanospirillum sp.]|uniref:hypothetical protein n=1 Tax=uncultured Methanospirillum sp. TaxID=262503 RepID=UPI0029C6A01F|nr:hypothetical protein [uncultured Methanospirillum sp.]
MNWNKTVINSNLFLNLIIAFTLILSIIDLGMLIYCAFPDLAKIVYSFISSSAFGAIISFILLYAVFEINIKRQIKVQDAISLKRTSNDLLCELNAIKKNLIANNNMLVDFKIVIESTLDPKIIAGVDNEGLRLIESSIIHSLNIILTSISNDYDIDRFIIFKNTNQYFYLFSSTSPNLPSILYTFYSCLNGFASYVRMSNQLRGCGNYKLEDIEELMNKIIDNTKEYLKMVDDLIPIIEPYSRE